MLNEIIHVAWWPDYGISSPKRLFTEILLFMATSDWSILRPHCFRTSYSWILVYLGVRQDFTTVRIKITISRTYRPSTWFLKVYLWTLWLYFDHRASATCLVLSKPTWRIETVVAFLGILTPISPILMVQMMHVSSYMGRCRHQHVVHSTWRYIDTPQLWHCVF